MTETTPTLPDDISTDRLPDDVTVISTSSGYGDQRNIHLFADCKHAAEASGTFPTKLGRVDRDSICKRCSGDVVGSSPANPWEIRDRLENELEPRHIDGLTPMPEHRQTPELDADDDAIAAGTEVIAGD